MNKKLEKTLLEMFGEPLDPIFGTKIGDVEDICKIGAVGVRDAVEDAVVCPVCGHMPPKIDTTCLCGLTEGSSVC